LNDVIVFSASFRTALGAIGSLPSPLDDGCMKSAFAAFLLLLAQIACAADLSPAEREAADRGRVLFTQVWVPASPHAANGFEGLGPVFNEPACSVCHVGNGRGGAPEGPEQRMRGMLVRLSLPGEDEHGGPRPVPGYGDQLNDRAIPGVAAEGQARISYDERPVVLAGGTRLMLRAPHLAFSDLAFGPLGAEVLTSARVAQPLAGAALLAAVPEADILAYAARHHGHPNRVWDPSSGEMALGRFGWKANQPGLIVQIASAALGDMGLTSALFPDKNCLPVQTDCAAALRGPQPDLDGRRLKDLEAYVAGLGAPPRHGARNAAVRRGEAIFTSLGCGGCHKADWQTPVGVIHPYTDLLLHDLGPGLADGRPDFAAGPAEWRTAPLWGLGSVRQANAQAGYLHDGRARSVSEAILWHGGEAQGARDGFAKLSSGERMALLAFLGSL
jgi:CxxC motif-containing protein (DUF1111 family)